MYLCTAGGGGGGWRWWREEDPYWPMRDWGDHPMRWWTWGLAGMLAGEGFVGTAVLWGRSASVTMWSVRRVYCCEERGARLLISRQLMGFSGMQLQDWMLQASSVVTVLLTPCLLCCAVLCCAVGGICVHAQSGSVQAAQLGLGAGALLGLSAVAMSDMRDSELSELGVKAAWGECVVFGSGNGTVLKQQC
jgi:hypothetical protein